MIQVFCTECKRDITMTDVLYHYKERHNIPSVEIPSPVLVAALESAYDSINTMAKR